MQVELPTKLTYRFLTAKEFQIICAHGNYKHIIPLNHLTATESGNIMLISSVHGYINGTFRDITFSFDINASGEIFRS